MEAVGVIAGPGEPLGEVDCGRGGDAFHRRVGERRDDLAAIGGAREGVERGLILHQTGEAAKDVDVGVGLGGDSDDEARGLAFVPDDAFGDLKDRKPDLAHHGAVLDHAVWDGDAMTEKGVGDRLAPHHRVDIGGIDAAAGDQHLGCFADRRLLGGGAGGEAHEFGGEDLRTCGGHEVFSLRLSCASYENVFSSRQQNFVAIAAVPRHSALN